MKQAQFEQNYRQQWQGFKKQLEVLKDKKNRQAEFNFDHFDSDYRQLCQLLALAKERHYSPLLIDELNELVIEAHQEIYKQKNRIIFHLIQFLMINFPNAIRHNAKFIWVATAVFYLPCIISGLMVYFFPDVIYSIFSPEQVTSFEAMYDPKAEHFGRERQSASDIFMFGFYISNNIGVSFQTFASGLLYGVGSLFYLFYNGLTIGAAAGHLSHVGFYETFFSFVCGHGAFELTAITFAGAAGLKLGFALLSPQQLTRVQALRQAAQEAITIVYGVIVMLVIAAFIEAFWSSSNQLISYEVKYAVAALFWISVILYFTLVGRNRVWQGED